MTREEEIRCIQHIRTGGLEAASARKRLVEAHLHLVASIAERYRKDDAHMLNLIQEGNVALIHALQTIGEDDQKSFVEQATPYIENAIRKVIHQDKP